MLEGLIKKVAIVWGHTFENIGLSALDEISNGEKGENAPCKLALLQDTRKQFVHFLQCALQLHASRRITNICCLVGWRTSWLPEFNRRGLLHKAPSAQGL